MNYGEELAYWHLRLNGFFPISNFVVHRDNDFRQGSDVDLLAIRPPYVHVEVGGQANDWDEVLDLESLSGNRYFGLICEAKTGSYSSADLFPQRNMATAVGRLGLINQERISAMATALSYQPSAEIDGVRIGKLFVSERRRQTTGPYLQRTLPEVEKFIEGRIRRYPHEKHGERMFFPSSLMQSIVARTCRAHPPQPR